MNMTKTTLLCVTSLAVGVALCSTTVQAAGPDRQPIPSLQAIRLKAPPVIDGKISDEAWKQAATIDKFITNKGGAPQEQTSVRLGYDDNNLYLAFDCRDSQMDKLVCNVKEHDGLVHLDDCVEMFFKVNQSPVYYHVTVNSAGVVSDQHRRQHSWDAGIDVKTSRLEDRWTVEMAIPFCSFAPTQETMNKIKPEWLVNFNRENAKIKEYTCWSATYGGFHTPSRFGTLKGIDIDFDQYNYGLAGFRVKDHDLGTGTLTMDFAIANRVPAARDVEVRANVFPPSGKPYFKAMKTRVKTGETIRQALTVEMREAGTNTLNVALVDPKTGALVFFSKRFKVRAPSPMTARLDLNYYTVEKVADLLVELGYRIDFLKDKSLQINVSRDGKDVIRRTVSDLSSQQQHVALDVKALAQGTYAVVLSLLDKKRQAMACQDLVLRKLRPLVGEVKIHRDAYPVVDGKPFFFISPCKSTQYQIEEFADQAYTIVMPDAGYVQRVFHQVSGRRSPPVIDEAVIAAIQAYLDTAGKHGVRALVGLPGVLGMKSTAEEYDAAVEKIVRRFKDHPALFGWYMADEPDSGWYLKATAGVKPRPGSGGQQTLINRRTMIRDIDPYHPVLMILLAAGWDKWRVLIPAGDMIGMDPYFPPQHWEKGSTRTWESINTARKLLDSTGRSLPLQACLQVVYFSGSYRELTPEEERCIVYLSLVYGSTGLYYFSGKPLSPDLWSEIGKINRECLELTPVLCTPPVPQAVVIEPVQSYIHTRLKYYKGKHYLIAVSTNPKRSMDCTFTLTDATFTSVNVLFEKRSVKPAGSTFRDTFVPFGTHVYEID